MSTGVKIEKATYGAGSSTVDVTAAVSSKVRDGVLNFTVTPTSLNVNDPAPGQIKTLDITYSVNGGSNNTLSKIDNDLVNIDAPPAKYASGLQIVSAEYGYPGNFTDVSDAIRSLVSNNGSIDVKISHSAVGLPDPNPNSQKQLNVTYTLNGSSTTSSFKDGERFKLSAPPVTTPSNITPSQNAMSFIGMLLTNVARFFGVFLHSLSVFAAMKFGDQVVSPLLWGGLAFFIPFFSFWALPIITFWMRVFMQNDVISLNVIPQI